MKLDVNQWNGATKKFTMVFAIITIIFSAMYLLLDINIPGLLSISLSFFMLGLSTRYFQLYKMNKMKFNLLLGIFLLIVFVLNLFIGIDSMQNYI